MPTVHFTANLARQTSAPSCPTTATTVGDALHDQGDHWSRVSAELPPVYCVRFSS